MINLVASSVHEKIRARSFSACGDVFPFSDWCGIRYMRSTPQDTQILLPFADRISDNEGRTPTTSHSRDESLTRFV